jgi:uncharacterized protein (DUF433 family)
MVQVADRITVDPEQCGGRPCIRGMRIRVTDILDMLAAGASREEILADYPDLVAGAEAGRTPTIACSPSASARRR